jgi:single-strand DNA-binding protein
MSGVNKVIILGRLGADPDFKTISSGNTVARMSVATSEAWTGKDGNKQERTEWHTVVVWGKLAEICAKYLSKGRQAYFEGKLQTRSWEDQQGNKRYATEIVANVAQLLGDNKPNQSQENEDYDPYFGDQHSESPGYDDDIPF